MTLEELVKSATAPITSNMAGEGWRVRLSPHILLDGFPSLREALDTATHVHAAFGMTTPTPREAMEADLDKWLGPDRDRTIVDLWLAMDDAA